MSVLALVNKWLPPPKMLRLPGLGVDISETSIKYIAFEPNPKGLFSLSLTEYGEVELGANVLSKGEINDVPALAAALAEVRKRTGVSYVRLSLPEERVYVFETDIEPGPIEEVRQQLEFRLEENVPLSPRDAYFDFRVYDPSAGTGHQAALVTVCARDLVDKYYEACRLAKVTPLSFEVESAAIARAVLPKGDRGTRILLDFGRTRTGLGIVHDGELVHTSTIDFGGKDLSAALTKYLGVKSEAELTILKNDFGLVRNTKGQDTAELLLPTVSAIKDEVQTRIQYWNEKNSSLRPIDHIMVCGGSANLRGLTAYLSETLGIETSRADVWQNAFDAKLQAPDIDRRHSYGYATAIGLALASYTDI